MTYAYIVVLAGMVYRLVFHNALVHILNIHVKYTYGPMSDDDESNKNREASFRKKLCSNVPSLLNINVTKQIIFDRKLILGFYSSLLVIRNSLEEI